MLLRLEQLMTEQVLCYAELNKKKYCTYYLNRELGLEFPSISLAFNIELQYD